MASNAKVEILVVHLWSLHTKRAACLCTSHLVKAALEPGKNQDYIIHLLCYGSYMVRLKATTSTNVPYTQIVSLSGIFVYIPSGQQSRFKSCKEHGRDCSCDLEINNPA